MGHFIKHKPLISEECACKTVELLDTSDPDQKWILGKDYNPEFLNVNNQIISQLYLGPELPFDIKYATMVTSPTGNGLVVIHSKDKPLLMLSGDTIQTLKWTKLDLKLQHHPRKYHYVSFNIPNEVMVNLGFKMERKLDKSSPNCKKRKMNNIRL